MAEVLLNVGLAEAGIVDPQLFGVTGQGSTEELVREKPTQDEIPFLSMVIPADMTGYDSPLVDEMTRMGDRVLRLAFVLGKYFTGGLRTSLPFRGKSSFVRLARERQGQKVVTSSGRREDRIRDLTKLMLKLILGLAIGIKILLVIRGR